MKYIFPFILFVIVLPSRAQSLVSELKTTQCKIFNSCCSGFNYYSTIKITTDTITISMDSEAITNEFIIIEQKPHWKKYLYHGNSTYKVIQLGNSEKKKLYLKLSSGKGILRITANNWNDSLELQVQTTQ